MPTNNTFIIHPNAGYVIAASHFTDITPANENVPANAIYESVVFTDVGTPNTASNTVLATVTWIADADFDGTGSPMTLPISVELQDYIPYYVKIIVMPKNVPIDTDPNFMVLPDVQFINLPELISVTSVTGNVPPYNYPAQEFILQGVIPANTNQVSLGKVAISTNDTTYDGNGFAAVTSGTALNVVFHNDETASMSDYYTPLSVNNSGAIAVELKYNSSTDHINANSGHEIIIHPNFEEATIEIENLSGFAIENKYIPNEAGSAELIAAGVHCNLSHVELTNVSPSGWISATSAGNDISLTHIANATSTVNTATLRAYSTLNSTTPGDVVYLHQPTTNDVTIKASFIKNAPNIPVQYGYQYPYTLESGSTQTLPNVLGAGMQDMLLSLYVNDGDYFYGEEFDSFPVWGTKGEDTDSISYQGTTTFGYIDINYADANNAGWITISHADSQSGMTTVPVLNYYMSIDGNFSGSVRSATITLYHPDDYTTVSDAITITQNKGFDVTTDTVSFMFNASQDYTSILGTAGNLPSNGTAVASGSLISISADGNMSGLAILLDSNNLPQEIYTNGDQIYQETGALAQPTVTVVDVAGAMYGTINDAININPISIIDDNGTHTYDHYFLLPINPNEETYYPNDSHLERRVKLQAYHPNHSSIVSNVILKQDPNVISTFNFNTYVQGVVDPIADCVDPTALNVNYYQYTEQGTTQYQFQAASSNGVTEPFFGLAGSATRVPAGQPYTFEHDGENYLFQPSSNLSGATIYLQSALISSVTYDTSGAPPWDVPYMFKANSNPSVYPKFQRYGIRSNGEDAGNNWEDTFWTMLNPVDSVLQVWGYPFTSANWFAFDLANFGLQLNANDVLHYDITNTSVEELNSSLTEVGGSHAVKRHINGTAAGNSSDWRQAAINYNGTISIDSVRWYEDIDCAGLNSTGSQQFSEPAWVTVAPTIVAANTNYNPHNNDAIGCYFTTNSGTKTRGIVVDIKQEPSGHIARIVFKQSPAGA